MIFTTIVLLATEILYAQKDSTFYKNEVKVSVGDAVFASLWTNFWNDGKNSADLYANVSFSYFYRPVKWLWVGGNFVNYFGENIYYDWREYSTDGSFRDLSKSKIKYCAVIAPEIKLSYLNKATILYSALSGGICFENGFDREDDKYPRTLPYYQLTLIGVNVNVGKEQNIFLGGEFGSGFKGFVNIHCGYRF